MFTVKDIVSGKFKLMNEFDLLKIEDVNSIKIFKKERSSKVVTINLDVFDYLFSTDLKKVLKTSVKNDLGDDTVVKFGIGF